MGDAGLVVSPDEVEEFIQNEGVDETAAGGLRELDPSQQYAIISLGTLSTARNPSAMLIGRIRDVKKASGAAPDSGRRIMVSPAKVEEFIQTEGVDETAAEGLRELSPIMQQQIIALGTLSG